jgi:hypothetical protein
MFSSWQGRETFLFSTVSRLALEPTKLPLQWVPWTLSVGVNRPRHEADHSPPSSAEVKHGGAMPLLPLTPSWYDAQLIQHRDNHR